MKRFGSFLFFAFMGVWVMLGSVALSAAEVVERILAVVNDEIITEQDLEIVMAPVVAQYRTSYTGAEYEQKIKEALNTK